MCQQQKVLKRCKQCVVPFSEHLTEEESCVFPTRHAIAQKSMETPQILLDGRNFPLL